MVFQERFFAEDESPVLHASARRVQAPSKPVFVEFWRTRQCVSTGRVYSPHTVLSATWPECIGVAALRYEWYASVSTPRTSIYGT